MTSNPDYPILRDIVNCLLFLSRVGSTLRHVHGYEAFLGDATIKSDAGTSPTSAPPTKECVGCLRPHFISSRRPNDDAGSGAPVLRRRRRHGSSRGSAPRVISAAMARNCLGAPDVVLSTLRVVSPERRKVLAMSSRSTRSTFRRPARSSKRLVSRLCDALELSFS